MKSVAVRCTLQLVVVGLGACAATPVPTAAGRVTIEHDAALPADEVAAQAMRACRQAGKANAAFETLEPRRTGVAAGSAAQASTFRCTP